MEQESAYFDLSVWRLHSLSVRDNHLLDGMVKGLPGLFMRKAGSVSRESDPLSNIPVQEDLQGSMIT